MFSIDELIKATQGKFSGRKADTRIPAISIDSRTIKRGEAFLAIKGDNFDGHNFIKEAVKKGAGCIISEPRGKGVVPDRIPCIEVKDTLAALGKIARACRQNFDIPVIAVTGSNGKTTTKEMIAHVLSKKFKVLKNPGTKNNQIGLPMALVGLNRSYDCAVLEIGTNHYGEVSYLAKISQPNIGVITNIGPAHLEYFDSVSGVFKEKYTLIQNLKNPRIGILNADDAFLKSKVTAKNKNEFIVGIAVKRKSDYFASGIKHSGGRLEFLVNQKYKFTLRTLGDYNIYNALAAIAAGRILGMEYKEICAQLADFSFPESRLNLVEFSKIRFIDDTYNANPVSLKGALEALRNFNARGRKIFIMGDMLELGSRREFFHSRAGRDIARACDCLIAVGKLSRLAGQGAQKAGFDSRNIFNCQTSLEARDILMRKVAPQRDDIILVKGSRLMHMEEVFKI